MMSVSDGSSRGSPLRCLTIDVEEYFHIEAAHGHIDPTRRDRWPSRVAVGVDRLLELMARLDRRATFFILGDVARHQPELVRRIAAAGHEVASHGTGHDRLHRLDPDAFREDLHTAARLIEDQSGRRVAGYRAPTFSVVPRTAWAIDVLTEAGYAYDASIFPVRHPLYGVPAAPLEPFFVRGRADGPALLEVPPLVWRLGSRRIPVAGGGYFRLLPLAFMRRGLAQAAREGRPAVLYFHPWEFDPGIPRMPLPWLGRLRTYRGLSTAAARLERVLHLPGRWLPIGEALPQLRAMAARGPAVALGAMG